MKKNVVIGLVGVTKDRPYKGKSRWEKWRPTVCIAQQEDFLIERFDLLVQDQFRSVGKSVSKDIRVASPESQVNLHAVAFDQPWDFESVFAKLYSFARDYPFDTDRENYYVHITTGTHVAQICLFLLTESRHFPARLLQTSPSRKRSSPIGTYDVIDLDLGRYDQLATRFEEEHREARDLLKSGIKTRNSTFNHQVLQIEHVAVSSKAPILLMGPTGAGKSQLAKRIFELRSSRHLLSGDFVEVNCATLRGDAAMSTLFGHKKGAFTGAHADRPGLLCKANGGLLFLDEIGELGLDEQAMLLRAVEEKKFLPVGADTEAESDFQLIAGTNHDLHQDVNKGDFREDLLSRIDLWSFHLPGLAQRKEDIAPNVQFELERFSRENGKKVRFNKEAEEQYMKFAVSSEAIWLGNFRDLNASITRMATLAAKGRIGRALVDEEIERLRSTWRRKSGGAPKSDAKQRLIDLLGEDFVDTLDRFDVVQLAEVVDVCRESPTLSAAGRTLFSVSREKRKTANDADRLRKYLRKFDLTWKSVQSN